MSSSTLEILRKERAAVFFHAPWSGPSVRALRILRESLKVRGIPEDDVRVIDVETDRSAADVLKKEGYSIDGWGEAIVVRGGVIRYFSPLARDAEMLDVRISAFLDEETA